jgi:hypothetical protein
LTAKIINDFYRELYPDCNQHTLEQIYLNIQMMNSQSETLEIIEQLCFEEYDVLAKLRNLREQGRGHPTKKKSNERTVL